MNQEKIVDVIHEAQSGFVNYILTTLEAVLGQDETRYRAVRKLILDRHNDTLRDLRRQFEGQD